MTKHSERPRDWPRMTWVKLQPCRLRATDDAGRCEGEIQADHAGDRFTQGDGYRADDDTVISLCRKHHTDRTVCRGIFATMTREERAAWRQAEITAARARWDAFQATVPVIPF